MHGHGFEQARSRLSSRLSSLMMAIVVAGAGTTVLSACSAAGEGARDSATAAGASVAAAAVDSANTVTLTDSASAGGARLTTVATSVLLHRESCRGGCVPYQLTLNGDGQLSFALDSDHVERRDSIAAASVSSLVSRMRAGGFLTLDSAYVQGSRGCGAYAMDAPVVSLTLRADGATHTVRHDYGCASLPRALREWGAAADSIASTHRWLPSTSGASR